MNLKQLKAFYEQRFGTYPLSQIALAPWNYKRDDEEKAQKLKEKLRRNKQIINVTIREYPDDEEHSLPYEILDGNHRVIALRELGYEGIIAANLGKLSKAEAMRLAVEVNEGDFELDPLKLSSNLQEILQHWPSSDLALTFPYSEQEITQMAELTDFDWSVFDEEQQQADQEGGEFAKLTFVVPQQALTVIQAELDRIIHLCGYSGKPRGLAQGLALEKMAANSAGVPLESLS